MLSLVLVCIADCTQPIVLSHFRWRTKDGMFWQSLSVSQAGFFIGHKGPIWLLGWNNPGIMILRGYQWGCKQRPYYVQFPEVRKDVNPHLDWSSLETAATASSVWPRLLKWRCLSEGKERGWLGSSGLYRKAEFAKMVPQPCIMKCLPLEKVIL